MLAAAGALVVAVIVVFGLLRPAPPKPHAAPTIVCPKVPDVVVGHISVPAGPVAGYCQPQLANAAEIIAAAKAMGLDEHTQEVGVMTAIGESGLRNLTFGDEAGPDSRGIFQQRDNWGSLADRMNPYTASKAFFGRLLGVPNWPKLTPTQAAHAVQANADPDYYTQFWPRAQKLVEGLTLDRLPVASASPTP